MADTNEDDQTGGEIDAVAADPVQNAHEDTGPEGKDKIVIKKYANRRLYNTRSSSYVTLEHLSEMVKQGVHFVVYDARTGEDITRQVLTQIIFEAESRGQNMLPLQFLRQLIQLYDDQIQALVPGYLEMSLEAFSRKQGSVRERFGGTPFPKPPFAGTDGYRLFEEQVRQNMVLFDRAMKMFTPFGYVGSPEAAKPSEPPKAQPPAPDDSIAEMKAQLDRMQSRLDKLSKKR